MIKMASKPIHAMAPIEKRPLWLVINIDPNPMTLVKNAAETATAVETKPLWP